MTHLNSQTRRILTDPADPVPSGVATESAISLEREIQDLRGSAEMIVDEAGRRSSEEAISLLAGLMEAATPEAAAGAATAFCAARFEVPAAAWFTTDGGRSIDMIHCFGLDAREQKELESSLGTMPRWELLDSLEQESVRDRFRGIAGGPDAVAIDAGDCLILVASDASRAGALGDLVSLLQAALRHLRTVALAEARNDSLDFGIALTAHEFLSPVVSMKHAFELLRRTGERSEVETKLFDHAVKELRRLEEVCGGLHRWSFRPEPPRYATVDLNAAAQEAAGADEFEAVGDRIRVVASGRNEVRADRPHLVDAIRNLLRCVLKASPDAPVEVLVGKQGQFARIDVKAEAPDLSHPSPPGETRWLDPFALEEKASLESGSRPRLDLFTSRKILESHGGKIGAGPGAFGRSFFVQLPLSKARR